MNFLNIDKNKSQEFLFSIFQVFWGCRQFFFRKPILSHFISRFMLFSTLKKKIEKCPFTYWLNGRWFLQIVDRDSGNLYPIYPLFPFFYLKCGGGLGRGGGGGYVFLAFYAISNMGGGGWWGGGAK